MIIKLEDGSSVSVEDEWDDTGDGPCEDAPHAVRLCVSAKGGNTQVLLGDAEAAFLGRLLMETAK